MVENTIKQVLEHHAKTITDKVAFHIILQTKGEKSITFGDLLRKSENGAAQLIEQGVKKGDKCLLIFNQGFEFIIAFFACQHIGAIPVPLNMPGRNKPLEKWEKIASDCKPTIVLTGKATKKQLHNNFESSEILNGIMLAVLVSETEKVLPEESKAVHELAFLQYTSGSTGSPKGVMVTQNSLMANLEALKAQFGFDTKSVMISWLPFYHDMGLILGILECLYIGGTSVLLIPGDFMSQPLTWLRAITDHKGTHTAAPNFAYELVTDKLKNLEDIDENLQYSLKSLKVAICGAEPVHLLTMSHFTETGAKYGLKQNVLKPAYGLAEGTLMVSGVKENRSSNWISVDQQQLAESKITINDEGKISLSSSINEMKGVIHLVSNGTVADKHQISIHNPKDHTLLTSYEIGEVWYSGPSVTKGYYANEEASQSTFIQVDNTKYLRTGDLGFLDDHQELYLTGRIKDVIIIRGLNHYPQDIERTAFSCDRYLRKDGAAAFSIEKDHEERLIIVQELTREAIKQPNYRQWTRKIMDEVLHIHGIVVEAVLFVPPMHVPRTTSGKIQRSLAKQKTEQALWDKVLYTSNLTSRLKKPLDITPTSNGISRETTIKDQELQPLLKELKTFLGARVDSYTIDERRTIPPYIVGKFGRIGLMGLLVSPQLGGLGYNFSQARRVIETVCSADLTLGLMVSLHNLLGIHPIVRFAKQKVRDEIVPELAKGIGTASFALSEPGSGSNPNASKTKAQRDHKGNWILNGEKCWVGSSSWASYLTVIAHSHDEKGKYLGLSAFLLPQGVPGLTHREEAMTMGMRGTVQGHFTMKDVVIPDDFVLGDIGKGSEILQEVIAMGRIGINSMCIGILKTVLARSKRWAENRKVSVGYLIDQPVILKRMNELLWLLEIIETYQSKFARWKDEGHDLPELLVSAAKIFATEETWKGVDFLMQVTAARGYAEHNGVSQMFRDSRVLRIFEGPTESLIADLGGHSDDTVREALVFLADQEDTEAVQSLMDEVKALKTSLLNDQEESQPNGTNENYDFLRKKRKYAHYSYGEAMAYKLIALISGDDVSKAASKWLEQKIASLCTDALLFDTDLLGEEGFEAQFERVLGDHEVIYTQPKFETLKSVSPFRDLRSLEVSQIETEDGYSLDEDPVEIETNQHLSANSANAKSVLPSEVKSAAQSVAAKEMEAWIGIWLEKEAGISKGHINNRTSFSEYGLDSSLSIRFVGDINRYYQIDIEPSIIWSYSTISELVSYLVQYEIDSPTEDPVSSMDSKDGKEGVDNAFLKQLLQNDI